MKLYGGLLALSSISKTVKQAITHNIRIKIHNLPFMTRTSAQEALHKLFFYKETQPHMDNYLSGRYSSNQQFVITMIRYNDALLVSRGFIVITSGDSIFPWIHSHIFYYVFLFNIFISTCLRKKTVNLSSTKTL